MFNKKEIEIYETDRSLSIVLDWFSPIAYFLAVFSTIWCSFLAFWYSMALAGGAPWIFLVFPLIHVAVGIGLSYYTLCLFKNKTYIEVNKNYLSITHKPIPWWKGNKELTTDLIQQIYVKEKISNNKNGTTVSYELRAKLTDGKDVELFNIENLESHEVIDLEERIERFLGIPDEPVRGEYGSGNKTSQPAADAPRRSRRDFSNPNLPSVYHASLRDNLTLKEEAYHISAITQFDWIDGDSDKFFQIINDQQKANLLYLEQNKALLSAFEEEQIAIGKIGFSTFSKEAPPTSFRIDGSTFYFSMIKKGVAFITGVSRKQEASQWVYLSEDKKQQIRFIDMDGQMICYQGRQLSEGDFETGLDLNDPPIMKEEPRRRDWDEKDFV
jgi:hypothetical protein